MTTTGIRRASFRSVSFTDRLSLAWLGRETMGVNVPSKSRNRIRRCIEIAASLARSDAMRLSRHALQVFDLNIDVAQTTLGPVINVVRAQVETHHPHPFSSFLLGHLQRLPNGIGHTFLVVRIDHQRSIQFLRGSCQVAHYKHTGLIDLRRHIFLGYEIHPVVYRSDECQVGHSVVRHEGGWRHTAFDVLDRFPSLVFPVLRHLEALIDLRYRLSNEIPILAIDFNIVSSWDRDLKEGK